MQQEIKRSYFDEEMKIVLVSWEEAYLLFPDIRQLKPEICKGRIIYKPKDSSKRISYSRVKKELVKTNPLIKIEVSG